MPANSSGRMNLKHDASTSFLSGRARCARCTQGEVPAATLESRALGGTAAGARAGATPGEATQAAHHGRLTGPAAGVAPALARHGETPHARHVKRLVETEPPQHVS
jgi:hypothetical protein